MRASRPDVGEEVVAFVIDQDERREVFDFDSPNRFHTEFGELDNLDFADVLLGENRGRAADAAEVKAAVLLAGSGDGRAAIALRDHHHAAAVRLKQLDVRVHAAGSRRAE